MRPRLLALAALPVLVLAAAALRLAPAGAAADPDAPRVDSALVRREAFEATEGDAAAGGGPPHVFDRRVTLRGAGFYGTSFGPLVRVELASGEVVESPLVILHDASTIEAALPAAARGSCRIVVENPDRRTASLALEL